MYGRIVIAATLVLVMAVQCRPRCVTIFAAMYTADPWESRS